MKMSSTDVSKPAGKSGRRSRKGERGKKAESQASPAPVQLQSPEQDQQPKLEPVHTENVTIDPQPAVAEQIAAPLAPPEPPPVAAPAPAEVAPADVAPTELAPVTLQTIANAYRDYTKKSFAEFGSFVEELSGARSLEKAMKVQTEFVKRAYETSVAESQRICELHNRLARQTLNPLRGLVGKAPEANGKP